VPTAFLPSRDAFAFTNSWPSQPGVVLALTDHSIRIGNAARGLCGGMVYAALDYWHAGLPPPAARPAGGSPLYQFITHRLIASWHLPAGVGRYYKWMNVPDADYRLCLPGPARLCLPGRAGRARPGLRRLSVRQQWPLIRASIDAGQPAPLGVVTVASPWPGLLGRNHQVLAYGYEQAGGRVRLAVYDPNSGPDDGIAIAFDADGRADRAASAGFEHNLNIGRPVRGFFLTAYSAAIPPAAAAR
jgi:hypothetical protein